nr:phage portal protein [Rummeliibacillus stabekisii]
MVVRRKKIDGGIILVKRYTAEGTVPFSLQIREVDDLDTMLNSNADKRIVNGIEYTPFNKPIAYYLKKYDVTGLYIQDSERIEAKDVIFLWNKRRPSQIREVSEMAPTLSRIRDVNSYMEAVSVKERVAACLSALLNELCHKVGMAEQVPLQKIKIIKGKLYHPV